MFAGFFVVVAVVYLNCPSNNWLVGLNSFGLPLHIVYSFSFKLAAGLSPHVMVAIVKQSLGIRHLKFVHQQSSLRAGVL